MEISNGMRENMWERQSEGVNVLFLKRKVEMWENRGRGAEAMSLYILNIDW